MVVTDSRLPTLSTARLDGRPIAVIGLGGIGSPVAQALSQFLSYARPGTTLSLIDGDVFEEDNRSRVLFQGHGNKAISKTAELASACLGRVTIVPIPRYVTPRSAPRLIGERSIVFLAVDNHRTRQSVSNRMRRLADGLLISGGNDAIEHGRDGTFGNVMIYVREAGRDVTSPLTRFHPEIAWPADHRPDQRGCGALAPSAPQLLFTNLAVASAMLGAFYAWLTGTLDYEEAYLQIAEGRMNPVRRSLRPRRRHKPLAISPPP
jgi:hypothetical protein